jgi:hypothetical protein
LFISEAPPQDGGFWTLQEQTSKQDDLREKLLPLLKVSSDGPDRALFLFVIPATSYSNLFHVH